MERTRASVVVERLMEDHELHEQLAAGAAGVRSAYRRARVMRGRQAVQDEKLYDHVRRSAGALVEAARRLAGKPEPEPERRWRRAPVVIVAVGVAALVRAMHRRQRALAAGPPAPT